MAAEAGAEKKVEIKYQAELGGFSVDKNGVFKAKLVAAYSETGNVLQQVRLWTKSVNVLLETKRRVEGVFTLASLQFKPDGAMVTTLSVDARAISDQMPVLTRMRKRMVAVTVTPAQVAASEP